MSSLQESLDNLSMGYSKTSRPKRSPPKKPQPGRAISIQDRTSYFSSPRSKEAQKNAFKMYAEATHPKPNGLNERIRAVSLSLESKSPKSGFTVVKSSPNKPQPVDNHENNKKLLTELAGLLSIVQSRNEILVSTDDITNDIKRKFNILVAENIKVNNLLQNSAKFSMELQAELEKKNKLLDLFQGSEATESASSSNSNSTDTLLALLNEKEQQIKKFESDKNRFENTIQNLMSNNEALRSYINKESAEKNNSSSMYENDEEDDSSDSSSADESSSAMIDSDDPPPPPPFDDGDDNTITKSLLERRQQNSLGLSLEPPVTRERGDTMDQALHTELPVPEPALEESSSSPSKSKAKKNRTSGASVLQRNLLRNKIKKKLNESEEAAAPRARTLTATTDERLTEAGTGRADRADTMEQALNVPLPETEISASPTKRRGLNRHDTDVVDELTRSRASTMDQALHVPLPLPHSGSTLSIISLDARSRASTMDQALNIPLPIPVTVLGETKDLSRSRASTMDQALSIPVPEPLSPSRQKTKAKSRSILGDEMASTLERLREMNGELAGHSGVYDAVLMESFTDKQHLDESSFKNVSLMRDSIELQIQLIHALQATQ